MPIVRFHHGHTKTHEILIRVLVFVWVRRNPELALFFSTEKTPLAAEKKEGCLLTTKRQAWQVLQKKCAPEWPLCVYVYEFGKKVKSARGCYWLNVSVRRKKAKIHTIGAQGSEVSLLTWMRLVKRKKELEADYSAVTVLVSLCRFSSTLPPTVFSFPFFSL